MLAAVLVVVAVAATPAPAKPRPKLTLPQLLERANKNPQLEAAQHAIRAAEAQWREAVRAWNPSFEYYGLLAPSPEIHCLDSAGNRDPKSVQTDNVEPRLSALGAGIFGRIEIKGGMPLYTFGKLSAAKALGVAGVDAAHRQADLTRADLELNVKKAYFGAKTAREITATITEGRDKLQDAINLLEKSFEKGEGDASQTDLLRLRAMAALIDSRALEAERGSELAVAALEVLTTDESVDVDDAPLEPVVIVPQSDKYYLDQARSVRPEARLLEVAMRAKQEQLRLEVARYYPDVALVAQATYAKAQTADDPQNAFYNDPLNTIGFSFAIAVKGSLDYHMKIPRVDKIRAEVAELEANRRAALAGIGLEVRKALAELREAQKRLPILQKGHRAARAWLIAVTQSFALGLAEAKEFNDSLLAYFEADLRTSQAIFDFNVAAAQLARASGADPTQK